MDWSLFPIFICACAAAASTGAVFGPDQWYRDLAKPSWTPPDWVFPVTWSILYLLIAVAAARIATVPENDLALAFWALQMVLNGLWSPIFFGKRLIKGGLIAVGALWVAVFGTLVTFFAVDALAGWMIVPYLAWVSTAAALNFAVWQKNPAQA